MAHYVSNSATEQRHGAKQRRLACLPGTQKDDDDGRQPGCAFDRGGGAGKDSSRGLNFHVSMIIIHAWNQNCFSTVLFFGLQFRKATADL
jgi:hypothetical protein